MTSMNTPVLFISLNANAPVDNVIVFGGVDVGKTNANEVASAVGTTNSRGLQLFPCASLAAIGTKIVAAPEFDTNSVNIDTIRNSSSTPGRYRTPSGIGLARCTSCRSMCGGPPSVAVASPLPHSLSTYSSAVDAS